MNSGSLQVETKQHHNNMTAPRHSLRLVRSTQTFSRARSLSIDRPFLWSHRITAKYMVHSSNMSVCLSVCPLVCLSVCLYVRMYVCTLYNTSAATHLLSGWLSRVVTSWVYLSRACSSPTTTGCLLSSSCGERACRDRKWSHTSRKSEWTEWEFSAPKNGNWPSGS